MSRPSTEAQYLASLVPPSVAATGYRQAVTAREARWPGRGSSVRRGSWPPAGRADPAGRAAAAAAGPQAASGTLTFGSNQSDAVPKQAYADLVTGVQRPEHQGHNQHGRPQHVPGEHQHLPAGPARRRLHLVRGLPHEVLRRAGPRRRHQRRLAEPQRHARRPSRPPPPATTASSTSCRSTTTRGRSSTGRACSSSAATRSPKTLDELVTLSTQMQKDGLVPIAFADKDGWPAMGTFDQLNLRINGYDFHVNLMAGKEAWDSDKVKKVFDTWNRLLPFHQPDALGRTWQEAAQSLQQKKAGHVRAGHVRRPAVHQGRRPGRPGLLRVPRGRLDDRHVRGRGPDRRLHDGGEARRTRPRRRSSSATSARPPRRAPTSSPTRR